MIPSGVAGALADAEALRLSVHFGDGVFAGRRLASDALMERLDARGVAVAALLRGIEGFGLGRRLNAERLPDVSTDLPLVAVAIDERPVIEAALDDVDAAVARGLVTVEPVVLASGADAASARLPTGAGRAATLTIVCGADERVGRRPAYRVAVDILRRHRATGAIVLAGSDGRLHGRRRRAGLLSNGGAPMVIASVGETAPLHAALAELAARLPRLVVTLEPTTELKENGISRDPLPRPPQSGDVWQAIRVISRRNRRVEGRALHAEITTRLRQAGAAGATTLLGDWGFSSRERPHGDRFGRAASHLPTVTVWIDRPETVARIWPLIDEATREHGIVTSAFVPAYRERAGSATFGRRPPGRVAGEDAREG